MHNGYCVAGLHHYDPRELYAAINSHASLQAENERLLTALENAERWLWENAVSTRRRPTLTELTSLWSELRDARAALKAAQVKPHD
jgi:hypothetical protein